MKVGLHSALYITWACMYLKSTAACKLAVWSWRVFQQMPVWLRGGRTLTSSTKVNHFQKKKSTSMQVAMLVYGQKTRQLPQLLSVPCEQLWIIFQEGKEKETNSCTYFNMSEWSWQKCQSIQIIYEYFLVCMCVCGDLYKYKSFSLRHHDNLHTLWKTCRPSPFSINNISTIIDTYTIVYIKNTTINTPCYIL